MAAKSEVALVLELDADAVDDLWWVLVGSCLPFPLRLAAQILLAGTLEVEFLVSVSTSFLFPLLGGPGLGANGCLVCDWSFRHSLSLSCKSLSLAAEDTNDRKRIV